MSKTGLEAGAKDINATLRTFLLGDHGLELYSNGIRVREDYLTKNPDLVKRFVRAALQGWKFTFEHPDQAAQDEIKFVPSLKADVVKSEIEIVRNLALTPDVEQHGLGWIDPAKVKANLDFVVRYIGVNGTPPEAKDLYEGGFLRLSNPEIFRRHMPTGALATGFSVAGLHEGPVPGSSAAQLEGPLAWAALVRLSVLGIGLFAAVAFAVPSSRSPLRGAFNDCSWHPKSPANYLRPFRLPGA
jgi:NMT1/THI5 like